jgi:hypothetical protein
MLFCAAEIINVSIRVCSTDIYNKSYVVIAILVQGIVNITSQLKQKYNTKCNNFFAWFYKKVCQYSIRTVSPILAIALQPIKSSRVGAKSHRGEALPFSSFFFVFSFVFVVVVITTFC